MNYTVEIRHSVGYGAFLQGESALPHTFLVIIDEDGKEHGYGFAPLEHGSLIGDGEIYNDTGHPYDASVALTITESQYNTLMTNIEQSSLNPPEYNLPQGQQCTVWALSQLADADIIPQSISPFLDDPELAGIIQTLMFNPYTQAAGFELYDLLAALDMEDIPKSILDYILKTFDMADLLSPNINVLWEKVQNWIRPRDPLVLDLDGDGVETFGITVAEDASIVRRRVA